MRNATRSRGPTLFPAILAAAMAGCAPDGSPATDGTPATPAAWPEVAFPGETGTTRTRRVALDGRTLELTVEEIHGLTVIDGDIVLGPAVGAAAETGPEAEPTSEGAGTDALASVLSSSFWPRAMVPYTIDPALPNPARVRAAIAHWEARTRVRFLPRTTQAGYVTFTRGAGCSANIGRTGRQQFVWLADNCTAGTAIHEIGHAVGLWHEQSRADRDSHVVIHWGNIAEAHRHNFQTYAMQGFSGMAVGPYDLRSIMHYGSMAFSANGRPTIVRRDGGRIEPQRDALSGGDVAALGTLYPCNDAACLTCPQVARVAGPSRYHTAVEVSRRAFPSSTVAVLVSGEDRSAPDALAAGPLARALGGPVLLTASNALPDVTRAELDRLGVREVHIVGGDVSVSEPIAEQLRAGGRMVHRISGSTRFDTAARVALRVGAPGGLAFVASGENGRLVDALAASGPAAALGAPILLVTQGAVPAETAAALRDLAVQRTIVVGGPGAVSDAVLAQLPRPRRVAGPDRFSTAAALAEHVVGTEGVDGTDVFVARADVMADALVVGAVGRVVLLSQQARLSGPAAAFLARVANRATLLGGGSALSEDVQRDACASVD